jgi:hypothetical protein
MKQQLFRSITNAMDSISEDFATTTLSEFGKVSKSKKESGKAQDPELPSLPTDDCDSEEDGQSDYYKYVKDPISEPDEEITLKKILDYLPELLTKWKEEIARETSSLIDTTVALQAVTPEWLEANKETFDIIGTKIAIPDN